MKTALDSSVLLDVLGADPTFGERSREALRAAFDSGALAACDVVWAEVRAHFPSREAFRGALEILGVQFDPVTSETAALAGEMWRDRRRDSRDPRGRQRVIADFLVGAHAALQADALVTRDRGFYRRYFTRLKVIDPTESP